MNKEKQIEEMAKVIARRSTAFRNQNVAFMTTATKTAESLYTAGYRKQSEGEWLPSPDGIQPIRCSKCNMPAPFVAGENEFGDFEICRYPSRYCHECGAKMKCGAE